MNATETTTSGWRGWLSVILMVLGVRCTVSPDLFPGWSGDPLVMEAPITGITPAFSTGLDVLTLIASAMVLLGCARQGFRPRAWELVLFVGGAGVAAWYSVRTGATLMNIVLGCQWTASLGAAIACVQACRDVRARRLVLAGLVGVALMVAFKGGYQVFVEHPAVYKDFLRNKSQVLSAQGWNEGSPMALAYERRISQADATGWFGLSNVFSTVMAGSMTVCAGMGLMGLMGPLRRMAPGAALGLIAAAGVFGAGVWLSHSKGGAAAGVMGLGLLASCWMVSLSRWRMSWRVAGAVAALLPFAAIAAVLLRGVIGERLSELSLYFRYFYLQGAARVAAESPLLGVGPDGFKDAYMRLKPALSPEDVSSPHSWFVDLIATLGLGGWAWAVWLVTALYRGGRAVAQAGDADGHGPQAGRDTQAGTLRDEVRGLLVLFGVITAAGALFEHRIATIDGTIVRVVSLVGAVAVGGVMCRVLRETVRSTGEEGIRAAHWGAITVVAAVVAVVTHCQIEMTGITAGAGMWVLLLLGVGASHGLIGERARHGSSGTLRGRMGTAAMLATALIPVLTMTRLVSWEEHIRAATKIVAPVPEFADRSEAMARGVPMRGDSPEVLARDLSVALGQAVSPSREGIGAGVDQVRLRAIDQASRELLKARNSGPSDFQTARALSRLRLILALGASTPQMMREQVASADGVMLSHVDATGATATAWAWLGTMRRTVYSGTHDPADAARAIEAFETAAMLAPHEPMYKIEAARLWQAIGNRARASARAQEALEINDRLRLDPLRQLAGEELAEVRRLARTP